MLVIISHNIFTLVQISLGTISPMSHTRSLLQVTLGGGLMVRPELVHKVLGQGDVPAATYTDNYLKLYKLNKLTFEAVSVSVRSETSATCQSTRDI